MPAAYSLRLLHEKYWYVRPSGSKHGFSTGWTIQDFKDKREVERAIAGLPNGHTLKSKVFDIASKESRVQNKRLKVFEVIAFYVKEEDVSGLEKNGSVKDEEKHKNFKRNFLSHIKRVENKFGSKCLDEITVQEILDWIHSMEAERPKLSNWSILKYTYNLSSIFEYARDAEKNWCQKNLITGADRIKKKLRELAKLATRKKVSVSECEVKAILIAYEKIGSLPSLFFNLDLNIGGRCRELRTIQRKNIDLGKQTITIQIRKAKKRVSRTIHFGWSNSPYNGNLAVIIPEVCQGLKDNDYIFSANDRQVPYTLTWARKNMDKALDLAIAAGQIDPIRRHAGKENEKRLTTRDFRHIAAQRMRKAGMDLEDIAEELGTSVRLLHEVYLNEGDEIRGERMMKIMTKPLPLAA